MKKCPKCNLPMKEIEVLGSSEVGYVCVNAACTKQSRVCDACGSPVVATVLGLGCISYKCKCGKVLK